MGTGNPQRKQRALRQWPITNSHPSRQRPLRLWLNEAWVLQMGRVIWVGERRITFHLEVMEQQQRRVADNVGQAAPASLAGRVRVA